ncbi:MAG: exonuclease [Lentisphaerae bacterium]|nr:MAG: exonuclease [Lentisphaerota bacterium]
MREESIITHSFCCFDGIDHDQERELWRSGIHDWGHFREAGSLPVNPDLVPYIRRQIQEATEAWLTDDIVFFARRFRRYDYWRLYPLSVQSATAYVDIETTGLDPRRHHITTICLYDGSRCLSFVHGRNLEEFVQAIANYRVIVTYNGYRFDLPFITHHLGVRFDDFIHVDLQPVLYRHGFRGGLKKCEKQLGLDRGALTDISGLQAIELWKFYRRGMPEALETLLAYNELDVINLQILFWKIYQHMLTRLPLNQDKLGYPPPEIAGTRFAPSRNVLAQLSNQPI